MLLLLAGGALGGGEEPEPPEPGVGGGRLIGPNRLLRITDHAGAIAWPDDGPWAVFHEETWP
jgi:hypothetical protein